MLNFKVNAKRCTRCGLCAAECPSAIIKLVDGRPPAIPPDEEKNCLECQHCLAVCPVAAISIFGRDPADSLPLTAASFPAPRQMELLVRGRRSIRSYQDRNVAPALIRRLLRALANCPTGCNRRGLTFTVIDDRAVMRQFRKRVMAAIAAAAKSRRRPPPLADLEEALAEFKAGKPDFIFRGAPHALIVSAPADAPCPAQDVALALAYFELLAQCAGLGTVWWGLLQMTLEALPKLKPLLGLPAKQVYYAMLFGMPAVRFRRTVQRDAAARVKRVAL